MAQMDSSWNNEKFEFFFKNSWNFKIAILQKLKSCYKDLERKWKQYAFRMFRRPLPIANENHLRECQEFWAR